MNQRPVSLVVVVLALLASGVMGARSVQAAFGRHTAPTAVQVRCKAQAKPHGTVRFSDWQWPDTLNPAQSRLLVTNEITAATLDQLFVYNDRGGLAPVVAASLPTTANGGIRDGGRTVTIHIRPGARWSDGAPITSRDVQFSLAVGKDPQSGPYCKDTCDVITRVDTPNPSTAVLRLSRAYAAVLAYGLPLLWPHQWKGAWNNNAHAAAAKLWNDPQYSFEGPNYPTNGPYQVTPGGFQDHRQIVLRPMKYYSTLTCGARLNRVIFTYAGSVTDMISAAAKRKTDITQDYTLADLRSLQRHSTVLHIHQQPAYSFEHLDFNVDKSYKGKANALANARVRDALALAIDKTHLASTALGVSPTQAAAIAAWTPLIAARGLTQPFAATGLRGQWDPLSRSYVQATGGTRALADAKKLLASTPFKGGFTIDLVTVLGNPIRQSQVGLVAEAWAKLGVKVKPQYLPSAELFGNWISGGMLAHGLFQVAMYGSTTSPDPDELKFNLQSRYCDRTSTAHPDVNANYGCVHDAAIDRAFTAGAGSLASATRAAAYARMQIELNRQAYWIPLYYRPQLTTDDGHVANFRPNPTQSTSEWNIARWSAR